MVAVRDDSSSLTRRILWFAIKVLIGIGIFFALLFVADSVVAWPIVTIRLTTGNAGLTFAILAPVYAAVGYAGCLFIIKFATSEETPKGLQGLQKFLFSGAVDVEGPQAAYDPRHAMAWFKGIVARSLMAPRSQNQNLFLRILSLILRIICFVAASFFLGCWGVVGINLRYGRRQGIKMLSAMTSVIFGITFVLAYTLLTSWASHLA
jgi:hypothetical protein